MAEAGTRELAPVVAAVAEVVGSAATPALQVLAPVGELLGTLITAAQSGDYAVGAVALAAAAGLSGWTLAAIDVFVTAPSRARR